MPQLHIPKSYCCRQRISFSLQKFMSLYTKQGLLGSKNTVSIHRKFCSQFSALFLRTVFCFRQNTYLFLNLVVYTGAYDMPF
jgi:hypothetical protein